MSTPPQEYQAALDKFVHDISRLQENGRSVLLYGSMARGDVIPGHSDIDFWVILADGVLRDRDRFHQAFDVMLVAGQALAASGLPIIHAFCYYGADEIEWLPAALVPNLCNPRSSRIVFGADIREQMGHTAASQQLYQSSYFFEMRRQMFLPLTPYLKRDSLAQKEGQHILASLKYIKYVPEAACAALDLWPGELDAVALLGQEIVLDMSIVPRVESWRTGHKPLADMEAVQRLLREALLFVEEINDKLTARQPKS